MAIIPLNHPRGMGIKQEIGARLREFRELFQSRTLNSVGTVREFADVVGVKPHNISDYERGASDIAAGVLVRLFDIGCNLNWLLVGIGQPFYAPLEAPGAPAAPSATLNGAEPAFEGRSNAELERDIAELRERMNGFEELFQELLAHRGKFPRRVAATPPTAVGDEPEFVE